MGNLDVYAADRSGSTRTGLHVISYQEDNNYDEY